MNRIILIGNGFDLAHGLKTSYKDFIDDYWKNDVRKNIQTDEPKYKNAEIIISWRPNVIDKNLDMDIPKLLNGKERFELEFENKFFEHIVRKLYTDNPLENWVDIEQEYYYILKTTMNKGSNTQMYNTISDYTIKKLNKDFDSIKNLLQEYLTRETQNENSKHFVSIFENILSRVEERDCISNTSLGNEDFPIKIEDNINDITILNFNYTNTFQNKYWEKIKNNFKNEPFYIRGKIEFINIHGSLNNVSNPIIFGFGDEVDNDYKKIEGLNDNDYLENVKSIKYLDTDNYKRLLNFINAEQYQVFIFGHSCGLSDRTLLSTLFEHENCVSIKPFYRSDKDNYSDIVRNISRHFRDKQSFRAKVVNKEYCKPLT